MFLLLSGYLITKYLQYQNLSLKRASLLKDIVEENRYSTEQSDSENKIQFNLKAELLKSELQGVEKELKSNIYHIYLIRQMNLHDTHIYSRIRE